MTLQKHFFNFVIIFIIFPIITANEDEIIRSGRAMDTDYPIEEYLENCGKTHRMKVNSTIKFISPFYGNKQYPPGIKCKWTFIGDVDCLPQISCSCLELRKLDDECKEEFLKISDGLGGEQSFCGTQKLQNPLRASNNGRDLFVNLHISNDTKFPTKTDGIMCEAKCGKGEAPVTPLPVTAERKEDFRCVCGFQPHNQSKIVGGEDADMNEFPWQVALVNRGKRTPKCGGSIINDRWILTAAHCSYFDKTKPGDIEILAHARILDMSVKSGWADRPMGEKGSIRGSGYNRKAVTDSEEGTQRFRVLEIINHPLFTTKYDYDYALLKLDGKIDFTSSDGPSPICLPPIDFNETYEGKEAIVSGWGLAHESAGGTTRILQRLTVPVISLKKCQKWMPYTLTQRMICAGYEEGEKDACAGDSGGPLQLKTNSEQWHQIGIVSWGEGCARKHRPGLYSRVTDMIQWIQYHAGANGSVWCRNSK